MLKLNIDKHCRLRNIPKSGIYLQNAGFSYFIAHKLLSGRVHQIYFSDMELLCNLFKCTPNDLFDWVPNENEEATDAHHLAELRPEKNPLPSATLSKLSYKELRKISKDVIEKK